jgi:hypothetical protein
VAGNAITAPNIATGTVVRSLNGLTDAVTLSGGANVSITTSGNNLQISASGSGGIALPFNATAASSDSLFKLRNTGTGAAVSGENSANGGTAVVGTALSTGGAGVAGLADTSGGTGVYGRGNSAGVVGASFSGSGVNGHSSIGDGVHGITDTPNAPLTIQTPAASGARPPPVAMACWGPVTATDTTLAASASMAGVRTKAFTE